ncbi:MAG TPA: ferritin-like domain-containing protein [Armatimonadota bacterium]|nr:ferritin-like domain-containing protein [Armatimonadota bacterium]
MPLASLQELMVEELKDIYSAETQILEALPKLAEAATAKKLKTAFTSHVKQTEGQVKRLDKIFKKLGQEPGGTTCKAMQGLVREGQDLLKKGGDPQVMDAALIAAAQKVEHYEIASYGTARTWAALLGDQETADLLQQTLDEEGETDKKLTALAEGGINEAAED